MTEKMRVTRAFSSGDLIDVKTVRESHFKNAPDKPIHRPAQSLFTPASGFHNFLGLVNWGCFLLLITTARMALENIIKYGIVMDPSFWLRFILQTPNKYLALGLLLCSNLFVIGAWWLERCAADQLINETVTLALSCTNLVVVLVFPTMAIWYHDFNPLFSAPVLTVYTVLFLKLWSYMAVNRWCRQARSSLHEQNAFLSSLLEQRKTTEKQAPPSSSETNDPPGQNNDEENTNKDTADVRRRILLKDSSTAYTVTSHSAQKQHNTRDRFHPTRISAGNMESYRAVLDELELEQHGGASSSDNNQEVTWGRYVTYPNNLTLGDLYYFLFAPTLCYELNFPRTLGIRKQFLLKRLFEVVFINQLILCLAQQWVLPLLKNSVAPIAESNFSQIVERCLKLAIPNHFIWLLFFYSTFHSLFNLIGELMCFGDRYFYSDWWNAETVPSFWNKWNIPVHRFARRHIYVPLLDCGFSRSQAGFVVFFISAVLHEFLISVPLKMPRLWAFLCMFSQMPYAALVRRLFPKGGPLGNVAVWITLIIGQPLAMLFYFHDYYLAHYAT